MEEEMIISFESEEAKYYRELNKIQKWFIDNDWKPNKIITGEWSVEDQRWQEYLSERSIKRARQDELKALLNIE